MRVPSSLLIALALLVGPAGADEVAPNAQAAVVYQLPFKGKARRVSQTEGKTHKGPSRFALDFPMPRGTPLYAARGGVVVKAIEHHVEVPKAVKRATGRKGAPNRVRIDHGDGTHAVYLHMQTDGAAVEVGQRVRAGQLIGYSGNTGKSSGPHLHFVVQERGARGRWRSVGPLVFQTRRGETALEKGRRYRNPTPPGGWY